jgi:hypothetical protein
LDTGGALWFADLTQAALSFDPLAMPMGLTGAILPFAVTAALYMNVNSSLGGDATVQGTADGAYALGYRDWQQPRLGRDSSGFRV